MVSTETITKRFLDFYRDHDHQRIVGSTLLTRPGDPVLFTTSGMHPLTPCLEGEPHPQGRRLTNLQRCLRTTDLDDVGDDIHLTVFGMLGSWSLGDYEGPQSLRWGYQFLRDGLGIDPGLLHVTVFRGNDEVPLDEDSRTTWTDLGMPIELTDSENWWSNGPTGLCGPDSEIFLWTGDGPPSGTPGTDSRWVEIWNHVMMRYDRKEDGSLQPLRQRNIDTGMGLERIGALLQGHRSVFDGDVFEPWRSEVDSLWQLDPTSRNLVLDHLRSSVVIIGDWVRPSNTGRGYVLRRLLRRVLTTLWRDDESRILDDLGVEVIGTTLGQFDQHGDRVQVRTVMLDEQRRFRQLLRRGRTVVSRLCSRGPLTEDDFFTLHDTYGLPRDLVRALLDADS